MRLARGCTTMHSRHGNNRQPSGLGVRGTILVTTNSAARIMFETHGANALKLLNRRDIPVFKVTAELRPATEFRTAKVSIRFYRLSRCRRIVHSTASFSFVNKQVVEFSPAAIRSLSQE